MYRHVTVDMAIYGLPCLVEIEDNVFSPYNWLSLE